MRSAGFSPLHATRFDGHRSGVNAALRVQTLDSDVPIQHIPHFGTLQQPHFGHFMRSPHTILTLAATVASFGFAGIGGLHFRPMGIPGTSNAHQVNHHYRAQARAAAKRRRIRARLLK